MQNTKTTRSGPLQAGSLTPGLEGAPCSASHENRMISVIPPAESGIAVGKEGSSSKG